MSRDGRTGDGNAFRRGTKGERGNSLVECRRVYPLRRGIEVRGESSLGLVVSRHGVEAHPSPGLLLILRALSLSRRRSLRRLVSDRRRWRRRHDRIRTWVCHPRRWRDRQAIRIIRENRHRG